MRWSVPETISTSAMDCGPACLTSMLAGFGVRVDYDRLRDACQTDVDGTSIDQLEDVARAAGLDAEQLIVPADALTLPAAEALPCIAVTRLPDGRNHFIVVWRRLGRWVQIMDPSAGRRWTTVEALTRQLYVHAMPAPADAWLGLMDGPLYGSITAARLDALGIAPEALGDRVPPDDWTARARLEAALATLAPLHAQGGLRRGAEATRALTALLDRVGFAGGVTLPPACWSALPIDDTRVLMRGAVLIRVRGRRAPAGSLDGASTAGVTTPARRTTREVARLFVADGAAGPALMALGVMIAAGVAVAEAVLFQGLVEALDHLAPVEHRLGALIAVLGFMLAALLIELPTQVGLLRRGRRIEMRLRMALRTHLPRLGDRYLRTRPVSDLAERAHGLDAVRALPGLAAGVLQSGAGLVFTAAGLIWLDPGLWPIVAATAALSLVLPALSVPLLAERDLRFRTHTGALTRYNLDALLGLTAIRTHGGQRALRRRHEGLMTEWATAALDVERLTLVVEGALAVAGAAVVGWLLWDHLGRAPDTGGVLLVVWWGLALPGRARALVQALQAWPGARNQALRVLEPLAAPAVEPDAPVAEPAGGAATIAWSGVSVRAAGQTILEQVDLQIAAGEHVAIVGRSGAGKSSLISTLLGLGPMPDGEITVDGQPLAPAALRAATAWVDPATHLFNRSLLDNIRYGAEGEIDLDRVLDDAELRGVLARLPDGLQSPLGEGGGLVSGGEGQRVRLARALARPNPRLALLDEPFRGLDRETRGRLLGRARSRWAATTLMCVTHDLDATLDFDRVVVIDDGRVVEQGPPSALLAAQGLYARLLASEGRARGVWADDRWHHLTLTEGQLAS